MKAIAIKTNHELEMIDTSLPTIKNNEILIKTLKTGICSTDRELIEQEIDFPENDDFLVLGHEAVGKVVDVGKKNSQFNKGDIVVPTVRRGCGECTFCNNQRSDMCITGKYKERGIVKLHGFMSEYFIEQEINLIKIPKHLSSNAVLLEPLSVGMKAIEEYFKIQKSRLCIVHEIIEKEIFKNILVIGAGPIGLLGALIPACHNANITCFDIDDEGEIKSNITKMIGGQYLNIKKYIDNDSINLDRLRKNCSVGEADLIVDASPDPLICLQLIDMLKFNGMIVHLGLPFGNGERNMNIIDHYITTLVLKNGVILGSVNANRTNFRNSIEYLEKSQEKFGDALNQIITHRFNFMDYQEAFSVKSENRIKVILEWDK